MMLVEVVYNIIEGLLVDFCMIDVDCCELWLVVLLYDCGKIGMFSYIVEKVIKLEIIFDCIYLIDI